MKLTLPTAPLLALKINPFGRFSIKTTILWSLLAFGLLSGCAREKGDQATKNQSADATLVSAAIQPPFGQIRISPSRYQIDPQRDTLLQLASGTSIAIPAGIFQTLDGQPVNRLVDLRFREFHTAADLLAAGIPMRVQRDNGPEDWLQTAGMFEINGSLDDQPVKIAPDKNLTVNLASQVDGPYDAWKFDPGTGNWIQIGTANLPVKPSGEFAIPNAEAERLAMLGFSAKPPVNPVVANSKRAPINIAEPDLRACPDLLARKEKLVLLYAGSTQRQKEDLQALKANKWYEPKLTPTSEPAIYHLTMKDEDFEEHVFPVTPNMSAAEKEQAQAAYAQELVEYEKYKVLLAEARTQEEKKVNLQRIFQLKDFGVYNYDAMLQNNWLAVNAEFKVKGQPTSLIRQVQVYLVTGDQRTVIGFPCAHWQDFRYDPTADNYLVAVLPGDKIVYFSPADFRQQRANLEAAGSKNFVFEMQQFEKPLYSMDELDNCLATIQGFR